MGAGPARGRNRRVSFSRALLPCLALAVLFPAFAEAQTLTPDMLRPVRGGFLAPDDSPLRRTGPDSPAAGMSDSAETARLRSSETTAPSRVGQTPTYGTPAANGASDTGYDSLNRKRKKPKY